MIKRIISAVLIFGTFFTSIFYCTIFFKILLILLYVLMIWEWYNMVRRVICREFLVGLISISLSIFSLFGLIKLDRSGIIVFNYFCLVWGVDIFAMYFGIIFSNTTKLAPTISPQKTWVGFFAGSCAGATIILILNIFKDFSINNIIPIEQYLLFTVSFLLGMVAQCSDLFVSFFKRMFSIKDSGKAIPGHGGVLDRFDSIILTAPILYLILLTTK